MKLYFISLCFAFVACITAKAQSKLIFKDKFMYADAQVFNESKKHSIPSMIDTGCSLCIIDSTFAVDSCEIMWTTNLIGGFLYEMNQQLIWM